MPRLSAVRILNTSVLVHQQQAHDSRQPVLPDLRSKGQRKRTKSGTTINDPERTVRAALRRARSGLALPCCIFSIPCHHYPLLLHMALCGGDSSMHVCIRESSSEREGSPSSIHSVARCVQCIRGYPP